LTAGTGGHGLPFAQHIEDSIDVVGQRFGCNTNSKGWMHQKAAKVLGDTTGAISKRGATAIPGSPIDIGARIGLGHMIPGIAGLKPSESHINQKIKDALDVVGPAG